jgi:hypothetical protein
MAVNPKIESFQRDLVTEYFQGLQSSTVATAPPFLVETLPGHSNSSLQRMPLHMHAQAIISTSLMWNINIVLCLPKALTLTQLRWYKMFEVLLFVRINKSMGLWGILNFRLLRDAFP